MEELKRKLAEIVINQDSVKRRLGVVAILTEALKKYAIRPVIVGRFAVVLREFEF